MNLWSFGVCLSVLLCLAAPSFSGLGFAFAQSPQLVQQTGDSGSQAQHAALAVESLQSWYDLQTGLYKTTGWWNSANLITALANYSRSQHTHAYDFVFSNTLSAAQKKFPGFINEYYDDEGWWALAWIDVYEQTHDQRYLDAAIFIFRDMTYGWDDVCSGGIWWSKERKYKNAIANELFLSVAAQLALATPNAEQRKEYAAWAHREWAWFSHSGMINAESLVNDGLTERCENNRKTTWTYNQGVILGGLASLARLDGNASALDPANRIAQATLSTLTDAQGILHESCEPNCGADGTQFKGIFVRNLEPFSRSSPQGPRYAQFILTNAQSIWSQVRPPEYHLGQSWSPPFGSADASTQGSALDALVAAVLVGQRRSDPATAPGKR